ncbi:MAG: TonB-dependent receptor [Bacteroidales bacterium]|nr:TonB-dependent receptor [Bacteroidales bacterium]
MKLTTLLSFVLSLNLGASVYSQNTKFNLDLNGKTVREVFQILEQQSKFRFFYNDEFSYIDNVVNLNVKNENVEQILEKLFETSDITYKVFNNDLVVLTLKQNLQQSIEGTITDGSTQEPLPGANVLVKGTTRGVVSDLDGKFSIQANAGDVLVFSYVGYLNEEVTVGAQTVLSIALMPDIRSLEEIVVVGYGTQRRLEVTGAISSVDAQEITAVPVTTADQALQGRAAGVTVVNNGSPGVAPTIRIRGISTAGNNDPLIVIDGVVAAGLGDVNPNDIESIQVLKDASTAAIYGSQGSNGVILVTTKQGVSGKVKVDFDAYWGTQWNNSRFDVLNTEQYIQYASSPDVTTTPEAITNPIYASRIQGETNWQDEVFQTGFMQNYNLGVAGGGENSTYRISGGYVSQEGIIKTTGYERYNFRANSDFKYGKLKIGENLAVAFSDQNPLPDAGGRSILEHSIKMAPYLPVYNENNLGGYQGPSSPIDGQDAENPLRILQLNTFSNKTTSIIGNIYGELEIIDGLKFKSVAGLEDIRLNDDQFLPSYNDDNLGSGTHARSSSIIRKNRATYQSLIFTNSLNYTKTFADVHNVEILALIEASNINNTLANISSQNSISDDVEQLVNTGSNMTSTLTEYKRIGYLGRLNYNYDQKYLFAASIRRDASSRFGANNRWGIFPSVAVGWRINKEAFMMNADMISNLKLRASWGKTGNDKIGDYKYSSTASSNMFYVINDIAAVGTTIGNLENPDLKWEEISMTNIGLDLGLLNNQFTMAVEYYINKSDDLLIPVPTIPTFGIFTASVPQNVGSVETKGLELQLGYNDFEGDFQWSASLNLGTFKNEVLSLGGQPIQGFSFENENISRADVGEPLFYFYGWKFDGIFQSDADALAYMGGSQYNTKSARAGDFRIADTNGDNVISDADRTKIGNPFPKLTAALNLSANYKGLDLNVFITGVYGNDVYNTNIYDLEGMPRLFNSGTAVLDRWTTTNPSNTVPRAGGAATNIQASSRFVEDGSYTRVKNITLGYTLPDGIFGNVFSKMRIYVSAQNLITLTDYSGLDPEIGANTVVQNDASNIGAPRTNSNGQPLNNFANGIDVGAYPIPKALTAGIQITF